MDSEVDVAFSNTERNINVHKHTLNFYLNYSFNKAFMPSLTPEILKTPRKHSNFWSYLALFLTVLAKR